MPTPIYLRIDDIQGESVDARHLNWIDVLSFSFGHARPDTVSSTGRGRSRAAAEFLPLSIVKNVDKASTRLLFAAAAGQFLPSVVLNAERFGGGDNDGSEDNPYGSSSYFDIVLTDVIVTSVSGGGHRDEEQLTESVTFAYQEIEWTYHLADGEGISQDSWDLGSGSR